MSYINDKFKNVTDEKGFIKVLHRYCMLFFRHNKEATKCNFLEITENSWRSDIDWLFIKYFKGAGGWWDWMYGNDNLQELVDEWRQEYLKK